MSAPEPVFHLLVNGRPFCVHAACVAGMQDAHAARVHSCTYDRFADAYDCADAWKRAHPAHAVAVGLGDCPEPDTEGET